MRAADFNALGYFTRFALCLVLVLATYNPEAPYSYFYWAIAKLPEFDALKAFVGVVLVIGWTIYIRATINSLGVFGLLLAVAFFGTGIWLILEQGWLDAGSPRVITYLILFLVSAVLATGLSWSLVRRRISGQVDVDEIEEH